MSSGFEQFLAMSGYAKFVWPSFALVFGIVLLNVWLAKRALALAERDARRRLEMAP
jgi:heme exporter protein CcmD